MAQGCRTGQGPDPNAKLMEKARRWGVGPAAALPSALLGLLAWKLQEYLALPPISGQAKTMALVGQVLMGLGLGLWLWAVLSIKGKDLGRALCQSGPYRHLLHPQYAAFITLALPGLALALNSWVMLAWALLLHPLWHYFAAQEEKVLTATFGAPYLAYVQRTGRFLPSLRGTAPREP